MPAQSRIIDLAGGDELIRKLKALGEKAQTIVGGALYREAEAIMTESKKQCPVDLGNLRASGSVSLPELQGAMVVVTLGYGGPSGSGNHGGETNKKDVGYAIVQHEDLDLDHSKVLSKKEGQRRGGVVWGAIGKAKYLEDPMLSAVSGMEERLANGIAKGIDDAAR